MLARQEGLTATDNRFHNPDERELRTSPGCGAARRDGSGRCRGHGWDHLDLGHGFHETAQGVRFTIDEAARRAAARRLLELNHQRYAEEVAAGLHEQAGRGSTKSRSGAKARSAKEQKARGSLSASQNRTMTRS